MTEKALWKTLAWLSTVAAAWAARQAATALWSKVSDTEAPVNPADKSVGWIEAAGWAAVAGLAGGLARVLARRGAAAAWQQVTGDDPPAVS